MAVTVKNISLWRKEVENQVGTPTGLHQQTAWVRSFLVICSASQEVSMRCRTLGDTGPDR